MLITNLTWTDLDWTRASALRGNAALKLQEPIFSKKEEEEEREEKKK